MYAARIFGHLSPAQAVVAVRISLSLPNYKQVKIKYGPLISCLAKEQDIDSGSRGPRTGTGSDGAKETAGNAERLKCNL